MALNRYREKRDFNRTPEPRGAAAGAREEHSYVVQKHAARALHYDFRLELDGVLLSWAVPKGPNLDPKVKRLAMQTEDHPVEYGGFEGVIPKGEYGGGTVLVWDRGTWAPQGDPRAAVAKGHLRFTLAGEKLRGSWHLVRTRGGGGRRSGKQDGKAWLLFKGSDDEARRGRAGEIAKLQPDSVLSGRSVEMVEKSPDRVWHSNRGDEDGPKPKGKGKRKSGHGLGHGKVVKLPQLLEPQLATLVDAAPDGDEWLHEIKLDGYRLLARIEDGRARLLTRKGLDWSDRMPSLVRALSALPAQFTPALLDGEVAVLDERGVSRFQMLQNSLHDGRETACIYFPFDLLFVAGRDVRALPLAARKELLRQAIAALGPSARRIRYSDHERGGGPAFFAQACKLGLEGIISKRAEGPYASGRGRSWLKIKCSQRQEFVIGGFTAPEGSRAHFGALLVGTREDGSLTYAGKVGTGFTQQSLRELHLRLTALEQREPPFRNPPRGTEARGVRWVKPELVAEIEFTERTKEGHLRHPSFRGLREDKPAEEVRFEQPRKRKRASPAQVAAAAQPRLSHPERVLWPEQGIQKRELAEYYAQVADRMLPHLRDRPLMLVRHPEGLGKPGFHQKHPGQGVPKAIRRAKIREGNATVVTMMVDDLEGLFGLVQLSSLEIHTWGSHVATLEQPDQLVFDLDPDPALPWSRVAQAARDVRAAIEATGLHAFVKSTGGKGLHVVVPLRPRAEWDEAKAFSKALCDALSRAAPARYVATMTKAKRAGKVFLDYLRNGRGATAVCAYSTRANEAATVSLPLSWEALDEDPRTAYDLRNVPKLVARTRDPWTDFDAARMPLAALGVKPARKRIKSGSRRSPRSR